MSLNRYSDDELLEEIERRKEDIPEKLPKEERDWSTVKTNAAEHLDNIRRGKGRDDDDEHFIYESVMVALYGKDVWKWINERLR